MLQTTSTNGVTNEQYTYRRGTSATQPGYLPGQRHEGLADLCDENIVVEFPFAPDAASRKLVGRAAIYEYLRNYPSVIDVKTISTLKIHATDDPNMAIAEWSASGVVLANGNPYEMSYATFVTYRDGLMVNYREYWNPAAFMAAMSGARF